LEPDIDEVKSLAPENFPAALLEHLWEEGFERVKKAADDQYWHMRLQGHKPEDAAAKAASWASNEFGTKVEPSQIDTKSTEDCLVAQLAKLNAAKEPGQVIPFNSR
jgi:hypothetical protein